MAASFILGRSAEYHQATRSHVRYWHKADIRGTATFCPLLVIRADIEQPLLTVPWLLPVECTNRPTLVPIRPRVGARKTHTAASGRMSEQLRRLRNIILS